MQNLQWRSKAKVVAWVHMVMVALLLALIIIAAAIITAGAHGVKKEIKNQFQVKSSSNGQSVSGEFSRNPLGDNSFGFSGNGFGESNKFGDSRFGHSGSGYGRDNKFEVNNHRSKEFNKAASAAVNTLVVVLWIIVGISVIAAAVEIWGAIMLLKATKTSTEAGDCYRKCRIYIIITSIILILQIIGTCFSAGDITSLSSGIVGAILRALFIFVAYKFMKEVEPYSHNSTHN